MECFSQEVQVPEARCFYGFQIAIEVRQNFHCILLLHFALVNSYRLRFLIEAKSYLSLVTN